MLQATPPPARCTPGPAPRWAAAAATPAARAAAPAAAAAAAQLTHTAAAAAPAARFPWNRTTRWRPVCAWRLLRPLQRCWRCRTGPWTSCQRWQRRWRRRQEEERRLRRIGPRRPAGSQAPKVMRRGVGGGWGGGRRAVRRPVLDGTARPYAPAGVTRKTRGNRVRRGGGMMSACQYIMGRCKTDRYTSLRGKVSYPWPFPVQSWHTGVRQHAAVGQASATVGPRPRPNILAQHDVLTQTWPVRVYHPPAPCEPAGGAHAARMYNTRHMKTPALAPGAWRTARRRRTSMMARGQGAAGRRG